MFVRKNSRTSGETFTCTHRDYGDDASLDESESSRVFRHAFIDTFANFQEAAKVISSGHANANDSWKDTLGKEGLGLSAAVIAGIIAVLGALSILSAVASEGIVIAVAVVGIIVGVAIYKYRKHIKEERYRRAAGLLDREDIDEDIRSIARLLTELYELQLKSCTVKDAHILAEGCVKALTEDMLKNKNCDFNELLYAASLQAVLMRAVSRVPKVTLDMNLITDKKFNMRGLISHSAYYCKETDEFYQSAKSKSTKYGVLFFDKKADLEDYESILKSTMKGGEQWKFSKMRPHEVHLLMGSSMFKAYRNDKLFEGKKTPAVVQNDERLKVT
jgi:hypothetical protein